MTPRDQAIDDKAKAYCKFALEGIGERQADLTDLCTIYWRGYVAAREEAEALLVRALEETLYTSLYICTHWPDELSETHGANSFEQALLDAREALKAWRGEGK